MKMTQKLATDLMDILAAVAISANGGISIDENGEPDITEEQIELVNEYSRNTFTTILKQWEETMGEEWEIEFNDEGEE